MIALDSDVLIEILDRKSEKGADAFKRILDSGEDVCTTVISIHEVLFGLHKYGKPVKELLQLPVLNYTKNDAMLSSKLELETEQTGKPIRRTDTMVAAIAINNNAILYTFDLKHFEPLKPHGLKIFK
ncbi:MAG: type II toxin-antitoxin system VapC family toxin [Candidatus Bathyarchaeia archaeon]